MSLIEKIQELQTVNTLSKHEQLVTGIINAIDDKVLARGSQLPSINVMVKELGYARKTIVKAYEELKTRGIVESKQFKGYYIRTEETNLVMKVALLMYAFHSFQETFYNTFRDQLGENVQVDVFFHHNNPVIFETILSNVDKKYGMYVVAPIQDKASVALLKRFPADKLLIVDRYVNLGPGYSFIAQEFQQNTEKSLQKLLPEIRKYQELVLFYRDDADYPLGVKNGFLAFAKQQGLQARIEKAYKLGSLQKGTIYLCIDDTNLFKVVKDCRKGGLTMGKEVGIISHNESLLKEIVGEGITTISSDFGEMATLAAHFVNQRQPVQKIIDTHLIKRKSV
ncbi:MAG: GntR family transcriptional regulator [Bacteroidota bacterium]